MDENEIKRDEENNDRPNEEAASPEPAENNSPELERQQEPIGPDTDDNGSGGVKKIVTKKQVIIAIAGVVVLVVLIKGISNLRDVLAGRTKPKTPVELAIGEALPVKVYKVKRMDFKDTLPVLGTMKGYKEVPLKFQTSGVLESFNFEEGERIQEGDIIANLEQRDALLKLKYAELELNSARRMFEVGGVIEDAVEKSRLEYESAKSDLEKTNIYAFADGVLATQDMDVGAYVTPNDKVGMYVDITKVFAEFEIIEKDVHKLKLGQKVEINVDAYANKDFIGTLDTISPIIEGRTRTQRVKVELKNPGGMLKPGMFTRGNISTYEKKNAVIIPTSSLRKRKEEGPVVFVVRKTDAMSAMMPDKGKGEAGDDVPKEMGEVEVRKVKLGYATHDRLEIIQGLKEGELIVVEIHHQDMEDKEKVEIAEQQEILY